MSRIQAKKGVLITLADVTELEEKNYQLQDMVSKLEVSQKVVLQQNKESGRNRVIKWLK